jgi:hypothetical protein
LFLFLFHHHHHLQRDRYKKSKLNAEMIHKLESSGFLWSIPKLGGEWRERDGNLAVERERQRARHEADRAAQREEAMKNYVAIRLASGGMDADLADEGTRICACLNILKGIEVNGVMVVNHGGSFRNEHGAKITPYQALQEPGSAYVGVSAQVIENSRPLAWLMFHLEKTKAQLMAEGWRWTILARIVDPNRSYRAYKLLMLEHQTQQLLLGAFPGVTLECDRLEQAPVYGRATSISRVDSDSMFLYFCWKPKNWCPTYKQKQSWK